MEHKHYQVLKKIGWILLFLLIIFNIFNWYQIYTSRVQTKILPFRLGEKSKIIQLDKSAPDILQGKTVTKIDSFETALLRYNKMRLPLSLSQQDTFGDYIKGRESITVYWINEDTGESGSIEVSTLNSIKKTDLWALIFNVFLTILIFFNSYLLLRFSEVKDNILIVFFLLFLAFPEEISPLIPNYNLNNFFIPFIGTLFYHFINLKINRKNRIAYYYLTSIIFALLSIVLKGKFGFLEYMFYSWTLYLLLVGFIRLSNAYRKTKSIDLRRLINAFRGLFVTLISGIAGMIIGLIITSMQGGFTAEIYNAGSYILIALLLLFGLVFIIGLLWFFGSFTWSLLTGTTMDVKIRSTLIYSIVGILFVTIFGMLDYSLGEFLQTLFGNFIGSEFIAGIPATIGLLIFFNPIRSKVELIVDSRLNSSELDFLSNVDTFSEDLGSEGIIEGFEEYICENLIHKLSVKKVALVSYDKKMNRFKYNEVRGVDIVENSLVEDIKNILETDSIYRSYRINENNQDISSFNFIIPIIFDASEKWFLALGKKLDGSIYTKKDEEVLKKLAERIKLSLKFILVYEELQTDKQSLKIKELEAVVMQKETENKKLEERLKLYEE